MNVAIIVGVLIMMHGALVSRLADIQHKLDLLTKPTGKED